VTSARIPANAQRVQLSVDKATEKKHVDAILRRMQSPPEKVAAERSSSLPMRMGVAGVTHDQYRSFAGSAKSIAEKGTDRGESN